MTWLARLARRLLLAPVSPRPAAPARPTGDRVARVPRRAVRPAGLLRDFNPATTAALAPGVTAAWSQTQKTPTPGGNYFLGEFGNTGVNFTLGNPNRVVSPYR